MIRRRKTCDLAAAASVCWLCAACCAPLTMTASNSINPVIYGPVKTLGAGAKPLEASPVAGRTTVRHWETDVAFAVVLAAGYSGYAAAGGNTATGPAADDETGPDWTENLRGPGNPARLDWKVLRATGEDPGRRVELTSVRCGGFGAFFLLGMLTQNGCQLEGVVPAGE